MKIPTRPKLPPKERRSVTISFRVTEAQYAVLAREALHSQSTPITVPAWVRENMLYATGLSRKHVVLRRR